MSSLDPVGYGRYVVSLRRADNTPVSFFRTDDLAEAWRYQGWTGYGTHIYDTESQTYVKGSEELA